MQDNSFKQEYIKSLFCDNDFFPCGFFSINNRILEILKYAGLDDEIFYEFESRKCLAVVAGFPLPETELPDKYRDFGIIAPFASSNFYREAAERCRRIRKKIHKSFGISEKEIRIFCNSGLPEKLFGTLAGLGKIGKNGLLINNKAGSNFIIAGIIIPGLPGSKASEPENPGNICGDCIRCIQSCPTGALTGDGSLKMDLCLQNLCSKYQVLSADIMEKLGSRIYGCQDCQSCCPLNKIKIKGSVVHHGKPGQLYPLKDLLEAGLSNVNLQIFFKGTVLSAAWMDHKAFIRNAIIACANNKNHAFKNLLYKYSCLNDTVLSSTADWALSKLHG